MDLIIEDDSIFLPSLNTAGYQDLNFNNGGIIDSSRQVRLWTAGCVCALHIVRSHTGPYPVSPFLIYLSLEADTTRLVNQDFVHQFDTESGDAFFTRLAVVEARADRGEKPYLLPFNDYYGVTNGGDVCGLTAQPE